MEQTVQLIRQQLYDMVDVKYQKFQRNLLPRVSNILGVRTPALRKIAKQIAKGDWREYLEQSKHDYFEEDMLYGLVLGYVSVETEERKQWVKRFFRYNHNWAVCDLCTGFFKFMKEEPEVWFQWLEERLKQALSTEMEGEKESDTAVEAEYVIRFVVVAFLKQNTLDDFTHNKAIQKIRESYRVAKEEKEWLLWYAFG